METRLFIAGRYVFFLRDLRARFGGAKMSGLGRQGGRFSMEFWTEPKLVCVAYGEEEHDG